MTVVTANETLTLPRGDIESLKPTTQSMMPDDQLKPFADDEVRAQRQRVRGKVGMEPKVGGPRGIDD